jgi:hypothetical protein
MGTMQAISISGAELQSLRIVAFDKHVIVFSSKANYSRGFALLFWRNPDFGNAFNVVDR